MSLRWLSLLSVLLLVGVVSGCQQATFRGNTAIGSDCSGCQVALPINGWCSTCDHGLVAGLIISSQQFHELLDAHGHDVEIATLQCGMCRIVAPEDEFCSRCRNGFVAGQLYFSELTWSLARGVSEASGGRCSGCQKLVGTVGQCPRCATHWVGTVRFDTEETAAVASGQYRRLQMALGRLEGCEECALAGFFGFSCRICGREPIPDPLK